MDQLSAHLDRGWDLLARGDARGARASARRALEIDPDSPEAHNMLGQAAANLGDLEEALEHWRQAMALDDGYVDPMLSAAEVLIHPMHDYDGAIALCDEVLEFVDTKEEITDALLLKFDALLAKGEREAAQAVLQDLPDAGGDANTQSFLIGRAYFEAGQSEKAEPYLLEALEKDPRNADAHYYIGLVRDERRDWRGATLAFLEARELDLNAPAAPWSLPKEQFHKSVERAVGMLDAELLQHLEGALMLVADAPGMEAVADGIDPRLPLLIEGLGEPPANTAQPVRAVRVFVYQRNIERICGGLEQLEDEIAWQLGEEVRHVLGLPRDSEPPPEARAHNDSTRAPSPQTEAPPEEEAPARKKKPRKK
jgi:Flp pilus assembly protein TadD/predicted Zn-dependent protease with MMP-like domain